MHSVFMHAYLLNMIEIPTRPQNTSTPLCRAEEPWNITYTPNRLSRHMHKTNHAFLHQHGQKYSRLRCLLPHLSTAAAWREKKFKHFVFNKYFCLVLGVLKSKISKKFGEGFLRKLDFKLFHYKAMVQPVSKITTIATRNRCWM